MGTLKGEPTAVLSAGAPIGAGEQVFIERESGRKCVTSITYNL